MSSVSGVPKELHKIMLNVEQDDFFAQVDFQILNATFAFLPVCGRGNLRAAGTTSTRGSARRCPACCRD